jgi:NTE family protein
MTERESSNHNNKYNKQRALILQGGGALGAYEVGVIRGLCKKLMEKDMKKGTDNQPLFDIVAGTSIGAMNAAVLVSNIVKKDKTWSESVEELERFWKEGIAIKEGITSDDDIVPVGIFRFFPWWKPWTEDNSRDKKTINAKDLASEEAARRYFSTKEFVYSGKKVFSIKYVRPDSKFLDQDPLANWVVLNDAPLQSQIELFGDFPIATQFDKGEPRLLLTAVDIAEGVAVTFDSYKKADGKRNTVYYLGAKYGRKEDEENFKQIVMEYDDGITIDQVMASGALPEFYDPKEISGRKFWDGGILSNTPLKELLSAHKDYWINVENKEVPDLEIYIVNVHPSRIEDKDIPKLYDEVKDRNNDILYGDRSYRDQCSASLVTDYIDFITSLQELASSYIKDENQKNAFQKRFERLKNEKAKSTSYTLGKDVKYEDLIRGRFESKVMRIERKYDATTSTSQKGADITIQTIGALIAKGEEDTKDLVIF